LVLTLALPWRDIKCDPMKSWDFLHVSDLHLSATSQYIDDLKVHVDPAFRDNAFAAFVSLYKNSELLKSVRYVIFSGDVTTAGEQDGFDQFSREVVPNLRGSSEKHFFIVPGNHDVVWSLDPKMSDYLSKKFSSFRDISHETDMTAALLPTGGLMGGRLEFEPRSPVWINKEEDLLVLCINSAIRCGEVNDKLRDELHSRLDSVHAQLKSSKDFASAGSIEQALHEIDKFTLRDVAHVTRAQLAALEYELNPPEASSKRIGMRYCVWRCCTTTSRPFVIRYLSTKRLNPLATRQRCFNFLMTGVSTSFLPDISIEHTRCVSTGRIVTY
jgi:Calcineurin-like phosphoesterase